METKRAKVIMLPTENGKGIWHPEFGDFHLYFTTDEEIKEGDWVLWFWGGGQIGVTEPQQYLGGEQVLNSGHRKIIASTDPKLIIPYDGKTSISENWSGYKLPQPSQAFIEKYCKVGGIDEVLVEYVINPTRQTHLKLRVDPVHNTIKDSWSSEEIDTKALDICQRIISYMDASPELKETTMIEIYNKANKWIEENL